MALERKQIAELRKIIEKRRAALAAEVREDVARSREESFGALAGPLTDTADEASADLLAELHQAEVTRDLNELRRLDAALARLKEGAFGLCEDCGDEIDFERLRVNPAALRCVRCQDVHEKTYAHPGEPKL